MDIQAILRDAHRTASDLHGVYVSIKRVGAASDPVKALKGQKSDAGYDGQGVLVTYEQVDFLIAPDDYRPQGQRVTPERGDIIIERTTEEGHVRVLRWQVTSPPAGDERVWRWSDGHESFLRVHTTLVQDEEI